MKREEVPQDAAILEEWRELAYAVDEQGRYVLVPTVGWDAANLANIQAWETIAADMAAALEKIRAGQASPLIFHMARHQMDAGLLAGYVGLSRWRVRRHLKPGPYDRLTTELRQRYAEVFNLNVSELDHLPDRIEVPVPLDHMKKD